MTLRTYIVFGCLLACGVSGAHVSGGDSPEAPDYTNVDPGAPPVAGGKRGAGTGEAKVPSKEEIRNNTKIALGKLKDASESGFQAELDAAIEASGEDKKPLQEALKNGDFDKLNEVMGDREAAASLMARNMAKNDPAKFASELEAYMKADGKKAEQNKDLAKAMAEQSKKVMQKHGEMAGKLSKMAPGVPKEVLAARMASWQKLAESKETADKEKLAVELTNQFSRMQDPKKILPALKEFKEAPEKGSLEDMMGRTARRMNFNPGATDALTASGTGDSFDKAVDKRMEFERENRTIFNAMLNNGEYDKLKERYGDRLNQDFALATGNEKLAWMVGTNNGKNEWTYASNWKADSSDRKAVELSKWPLKLSSQEDLAGMMKTMEKNDWGFNQFAEHAMQMTPRSTPYSGDTPGGILPRAEADPIPSLSPLPVPLRNPTQINLAAGISAGVRAEMTAAQTPKTVQVSKTVEQEPEASQPLTECQLRGNCPMPASRNATIRQPTTKSSGKARKPGHEGHDHD